MAETPIQPEHAPVMARMTHVLEWLSSERVRLEAELQHVREAGQREESKLLALLQQGYGLNAQHVPVTVDVERGVLVTPDDDEPPAPPPATVAAR